MSVRKPTATIAIIGGGFTGGAVAWNLARQPSLAGARILVFEPRGKLGAGLAYDTANPVHRINVPATRMSLDPTQPEDFAEWLRQTGSVDSDPDSLSGDGNTYPRREAFGDYVWSRIQPFVDTGAIHPVRTRVARVEAAGQGWKVIGEDATEHRADCVVIATSHPAPSAPRMLSSMLEGHPRFIADATRGDALEPIRATDAVLVVGNGLTSADVVASLMARGHKGHITSISRRGLRSRGHAASPQPPFGDFVTRPITSARLLTRRVREAIDQAALFGVSWHAIIDAARAQGGEIWSRLSIAERRRLVRHLRPFWDVHRFRIAPQVEQALEDATRQGQLDTLAASVAAVSYHGEKIRVALKQARSTDTSIRDFDAVVVTTGPAHGAVIDSQDYLAHLAKAGLARLDPTRLGLACDAQSRLIGSEGQVVTGIYVAGPLSRGTFGEMMGLPQVSEHAQAVAQEVAAFTAGVGASVTAA
jgi:uncharacterized NAD(P)/FAD-binding protein YdhS